MNFVLMSVDVSFVIVHTFEKRLLRQTLRGIRRAAPQLVYEVIVVDNNPDAGLHDVLRKEFPEVLYRANEKNLGFGAAMNKGIAIARGKYVLIFNPDIVLLPGSLEQLYDFMEHHSDIGILGPQLVNPDGGVQRSFMRFHSPWIPVYRRTPLGRLSFGKRAVEHFLMEDADCTQVQDVDWLLGAALFSRKSVLDSVGGFDDGYFLYFEDTDLCRRVWMQGSRVVYFPQSRMIHYHRRASSDGSLIAQLFSWSTRKHMASAVRYFRTYWNVKHPRHVSGAISTDISAVPSAASTPGASI